MSFGIGILAARVAGVAQYGAYAYAMSILTVATVVGTLGLDRLVVREVATCGERADDRELRGLLRWSQILGIGASLGAVFLGALLWPGARGQRVYRHRVWGLVLVPLLLTNALSVATNQADMLILGGMKGAAAAGIYSASIRSAALIGFVLASANLAMAPTFALLHSSGDIVALQRLVTKSARYILLLATPVTVAMILGGRLLLAAFGVDFIAGITPLRILSVGQWVNAGMGSVAFLLIMTGHARDVTIGLAAGLALNFALSVLLVPHFGTAGAATAATASVIFWNGVLAWCVHKRLGVDGTAAGIFTKRRSG